MITCTFENGNTANLRHVVVDTLVLLDDKILLVKRANKLLEGGKWALPGGYMDRDETATKATAREVFEETGYRVSALTLLTIIDHPRRRNETRQNISLVYFCTALEKEGSSDWEVEDQQWFDLNKLPDDEQIAFDHAEMIALYKRWAEKKFALPGTL